MNFANAEESTKSRIQVKSLDIFDVLRIQKVQSKFHSESFRGNQKLKFSPESFSMIAGKFLVLGNFDSLQTLIGLRIDLRLLLPNF